jgi:oligopeptide transport system ATP-binding protein
VSEPLLRVEGLTKHFPVERPGLFRRQRGTVHAVDDVSFELHPGETLGLVGETGSGKSTIGRLLVGLETPTAGRILYRGRDIAGLSRAEWRQLRREIQMIFQDPYSSLNPRMTVEQLIQEPWLVHDRLVPRGSWAARTRELLDQVGLPADAGARFPHQFSGGQRQRIGIARALALEPRLIVCDEPVSALDVSIQAQVINLLTRLQRELGIAYLFIAHDLSVVKHISHRVAVLYLGRIIEIGSDDQVYHRALHPYTHALLSAVPTIDDVDSDREGRIVLEGELPDPLAPPPGCSFSTRCWRAGERCYRERPLLETRGFDHPSACHHAGPRETSASPSRPGGDRLPLGRPEAPTAGHPS